MTDHNKHRGNTYSGLEVHQKIYENCENMKMVVYKKLNISFTNADSLMNKYSKFMNTILLRKKKPAVTGIVEVKPKNCKNLPLISVGRI